MAIALGNTDYVLTTSAADALAAGTTGQLLILKASVCNTDASARTISIYRISNSGSASAADQLIKDFSVGAGATEVLPISGQTLTPGQTLQGLASAGAVVTLSIGYASVT